jgi:signal transduction histidine kinase
MDARQSPAIRDALRIFRLKLIIQLVFTGLSIVVVFGLRGIPGRGAFLRFFPTLLLAVLFLPSWLERGLGRSYLAVGLGLDLFFSSWETAALFGDWSASALARFNLPDLMVQYLQAGPPIEPFFFMLIPLVLLAWGYGRQGALWGSTWAAVLHLSIGITMVSQDSDLRIVLAQALVRIALLYLVPLIISVLAERERQQHTELEVAHDRLRRHTATVEQLATSRERNRLARDLHDTLAHSLSGLTVQLEALRTLMAHDPKAAQDAVDEISVLAKRGLEESRQAIQALRSDRVETVGLSGALRDALLAFQARTGVPADLTVAGEEPDLEPDESQALSRIAEEALSNVERHASAQEVKVRLAFGSDRVDLVITDDGAGFDPASVDLDRYGLTGMRERATMVGATLEVNSHPGGGTQVWCSLRK